MSICRRNVNSFFNLHIKEETQYSSIEAFHQTPGDHSLPSNADKPMNPFYSGNVMDPSPVTGNIPGEFKVSDIGLMSCTESLGSESSEEMISSLDEGSFSNSKESSTSSSCSRILSCCSSSSSSSGTDRRRREKKKMNLPPPLTSLSENGRRNFTLKSVRKDGRLEIVGVMIERPEILCASRSNGRLRLHVVQTFIRNYADDEEEEEIEVEEDASEDGGEEVVDAAEEDQWRVVTAAAARRCYHMREVQVWGQQHRYVTTV